MARRLKIAINVDDRTNALTDEALICRTFGHKWERRSASRRRTLELLETGLVEYNRYCGNGCGGTWRQVWSIDQRAMVENDRQYPKNGEYLLPKGSGRLHRGDAFVANFAREFAEFV